MALHAVTIWQVDPKGQWVSTFWVADIAVQVSLALIPEAELQMETQDLRQSAQNLQLRDLELQRRTQYTADYRPSNILLSLFSSETNLLIASTSSGTAG